MTSGLTHLPQILATLDPVVREGEFVFVLAPPDRAAELTRSAAATVVEDEGLTVVLHRHDADDAGLRYDFVAAWITLRVHSSLAAVGLTAVFAAALADAAISCNVLAGLHHDHLLVPAHDVDTAMAVLRSLKG